MRLFFEKYILKFKSPAGTSRGVLNYKTSYFVAIQKGKKIGIGECSFIEGLSRDDLKNYEKKLEWLQKNINLSEDILFKELEEYPSIKFGLEMAMISLNSDQNLILFPSEFTDSRDSIKINGLIWMGGREYIDRQISEKIDFGFDCIKMKIGVDFDMEYDILKSIRRKYGRKKLEIRVDANGAFSYEESLIVLDKLKKINIHSIEQPIEANQLKKMVDLCEKNIVPIALDEELIRCRNKQQKIELLTKIKPQYIILKPSILGGFSECLEWIEIAERYGISWWVTSALESNIGLNAISQWTYTLNNRVHQGLGTGNLYTNNVYSRLKIIEGGKIVIE